MSFFGDIGDAINNFGPGGLGLVGGPSWSDVGDFVDNKF